MFDFWVSYDDIVYSNKKMEIFDEVKIRDVEPG